MSVPDFQTLMLPVLKQLAAGGEQAPAAVREAVATAFQLTPEDLAELLPSGRQATFANRIAWALGYLKQAGLVESPRRGVYRLTERGRAALAENLDRIDIQYLSGFQNSLPSAPLLLPHSLTLSRRWMRPNQTGPP